MKRIGSILAMAALMAKPEGETPKRGKGNSGGGSDAPSAEPEADGWRKVETERPYYNVEKCRSTPVQGYLLSLDEMPPTDNGAWSAFIVKLTAPCLVTPVGAPEDAEPVTANVGDEICVPATVKLRTTLSRYLVPQSIFELRIAATEKVKLEGRRTMWLFDVRANERSIKARPPLYALRPAVARQRSSEDEIPF